MSKYDPLTAFLKSKGGREVRVRFSELETILGFALPAKSKANRAWWSNNPNNSVMTKAWLQAGYRSAQVDMAGEKLSFVPDPSVSGFSEMKQAEFAATTNPDAAKSAAGDKKPRRHPAWGALKGMITLRPDVDLATPAYEDWNKLYGEDD